MFSFENAKTERKNIPKSIVRHVQSSRFAHKVTSCLACSRLAPSQRVVAKQLSSALAHEVRSYQLVSSRTVFVQQEAEEQPSFTLSLAF